MAGMTVRRLKAILDRREWPQIDVAVETGTFEGATTRLLAMCFSRVVTVEKGRERWARNLLAVDRPANAEFLLGDSAELVVNLAERYGDERVFWYLDAHWTKGKLGQWKLPVEGKDAFPLWKELGSIAGRVQSDIVIVDDVHAFGRPDEWENVNQETLDEALGPRLVGSEILNDQYVAWMKDAA